MFLQVVVYHSGGMPPVASNGIKFEEETSRSAEEE